MATTDRTITQGNTITLFIEVRDIDGILVDSETSPQVSIFDFDSDPRQSTTADAEALVLNSTTVTRVAQGIYSFSYSVAVDAHVGTWFDRWIVTIDDVLCTAVLQFDINASSPVIDAASVNEGTTVLLQNNAIVVTIDDSIMATDSSVLDDGYEYYFTTSYSPLYSTVKKVRLRAGVYLKNVPDDTINLSIFESSLEADMITFGMVFPPEIYDAGYPAGWELSSGEISPTFFSGRLGNPQYLGLAREKYVTCMAIWYMLSNSLGPTAKKKRLADFSIDYGSGDIKAFMGDLSTECERWEEVLNSGAQISKGSSLPSRMSVRGAHDPDAPKHGRRMLHSEGIPAMNTKVRYPHSNSRWKHTFRNR